LVYWRPMPTYGRAQKLIRSKWLWASLFFFALLTSFLVPPIRYVLRSYSMLAHFLDPHATGPILRLETYQVVTEDVSIPASAEEIPARLYLPVGVANPSGMVVVHGMHHLGMNEPRLVNFSRAVAGSGFAVLTPQIAALADYHVDSQSIATIGESTEWLEQRLSKGPVALTGISFAGGLSLLAALDPFYAPHIRMLGVLGAYDDLSRVSRFLITNQAELPDGGLEPYTAHEYGALVFVYAHLGRFFSPEDMPVAHDGLRFWLWEQPQNAQARLPALSTEGRERMEMLFSHRVDDLRAQILQEIQRDRSELSAISPQGKLGALRVPVYILHGEMDDIIPSTESLWLEREVPRADLGEALITPAFAHVDPEKHAGWRDELRLIYFVARFLHAAG
jgi:pimeloyl-ACP methyl ester carboxylesterase